MPNIKSAKKRVLVSEKKNLQNRMIKSSLKTATKKFLAAVDAKDIDLAKSLYVELESQLDSAASKGVIHKNNAANKKSGLAKKLATIA